MALIKTLNYKGQDYNYWKVISKNENRLNNTTFINIALYFNKDIRTASVNNYVMTINKILTGIDLTIQDIYENLKTTPEFTGATDDL